MPLTTVATRAISLIRCFVELPHSGDAIEFCFNGALKPLQIRSEFEQLADAIKKLKPKVAMEIGTNSGGTLYVLCRLADPNATIISLDLRHGPYGGGYHPLRIPIYKRFAAPAQRLHLVRADSHSPQTLERITGLLGGSKLDYLFIDGDHTYEGVKRDFEMYSPLVRDGGIIAFHDIVEHRPDDPALAEALGLHCEVVRFWEEIKPSHSHWEIVENRNQGWAGIGVLHI